MSIPYVTKAIIKVMAVYLNQCCASYRLEVQDIPMASGAFLDGYGYVSASGLLM